MTANKLEGKARELVEKWRTEAATGRVCADRPGISTEASITMHALVDMMNQLADELAAMLDTARQSEGMVLVPRENLLAAAALLEGTGNVVDRREAEVLRKFAAAPADAGEVDRG